MRICCMADLHGHLPDLEPCDLILIAGDICPHSPTFSLKKPYNEALWQKKWLMDNFIPWQLRQEKAGRWVNYVAGNHDFGLSNFPANGDYYLQDSPAKFNDVIIYGTPWQPWFYDWAFNAPRDDVNEYFLAEKFSPIPKCDILISHGPPHGILDQNSDGDSVGSKALLKRIQQVKPKLVVFGHIHEQGGKQVTIDGTTYVNAAMCDLRNKPIREPLYLEIDL